MTVAHIDRAARKLAEGMNGGGWLTHYTETQRALWRRRVADIWGLK